MTDILISIVSDLYSSELPFNHYQLSVFHRTYMNKNSYFMLLAAINDFFIIFALHFHGIYMWVKRKK
ncbi:MAG: hypothetical protein LBI60_01770 [Bacteroidales bacterium]|nr:hypothetical protein [Bacteroidales bacterium]